MTDLSGHISIVLMVVLFLIFAVVLFYKKRQQGTGLIRLVEYFSFGPKRGIAALKVGKLKAAFKIRDY